MCGSMADLFSASVDRFVLIETLALGGQQFEHAGEINTDSTRQRI
jgi:hypothetical protein